MFVLLSAGFKEEDLGSCSHPACRAELFGWRVTSSAEGLLAATTSTLVQTQTLSNGCCSTSSSKCSGSDWSILVSRKWLNIPSVEAGNTVDLPGLSLLC